MGNDVQFEGITNPYSFLLIPQLKFQTIDLVIFDLVFSQSLLPNEV